MASFFFALYNFWRKEVKHHLPRFHLSVCRMIRRKMTISQQVVGLEHALGISEQPSIRRRVRLHARCWDVDMGGQHAYYDLNFFQAGV